MLFPQERVFFPKVFLRFQARLFVGPATMQFRYRPDVVGDDGRGRAVP
jgi:hypothetical protein